MLERTMKVPFRLKRRPEAGPPTALLLPGHCVADVLHLCTELGYPTFPQLFAVADGFLIKLPEPARKMLAGVVRLTELAPDLLVPVDAELVPSLLPDEATALVRQRGLVFLPGGRVLEYSPAKPVLLSDLVAANPLKRRPWQPLPRATPLAERITEISLALPMPPPDEMLDAGGEGIGEESPRPPRSGLPSKALGGAAYGLGKGMSWLGNKLGLGGLANLGKSLMGAGMSLFPRLTEALLGRHEASLRNLLKDFQDGNIDRALRRAVPLSGEPNRGPLLPASGELPNNDPVYSLGGIFSRGSGSSWMANPETYWELERAYRQQAQLAAQRGDWRRAAYIYGKLLGDYRAAAAVLARGGLHRDAALIYQKKLNDLLAAAREFEADGDIDRAVHLYRQSGEHARAGDLLRRAGDEDAAIAEYRRAAETLVSRGQGHYQAGELMLNRARRPDLALEYYGKGWENRPQGAAVPCALRLAQLHVQAAAPDQVQDLVAEAEEFFRPLGNDGPAAEFFNEIARLADQPALAEARDDLRDRARLALAGKLRQRVEGGSRTAPVSVYFAAGTIWQPGVVSDAHYAVRRPPVGPAVPAASSAAFTATVIQGRIPVVTAVCQAQQSGDLFLGFESGEVACFSPLRGEVIFLDTRCYGPVTSLAVNAGGDLVVALSGEAGTVQTLAGFQRDCAGFRLQESRSLDPADERWLCGLWEDEPMPLWEDGEVKFLVSLGFIQSETLSVPPDRISPQDAILLPLPLSGFGRGILLFEGTNVVLHGARAWKEYPLPKSLGWRPTLPSESTLHRPPVSLLCKEKASFELAGIGPEGTLYWSEIRTDAAQIVEIKTEVEAGPEPFLAVALLRPGIVAAVTPTTVQFLRRGPRGFGPVIKNKIALPSTVACFAHQAARELIIVGSGGSVARLAHGI
jgi:tetratricopeptide (TPR) repeat protein